MTSEHLLTFMDSCESVKINESVKVYIIVNVVLNVLDKHAFHNKCIAKLVMLYDVLLMTYLVKLKAFLEIVKVDFETEFQSLYCLKKKFLF